MYKKSRIISSDFYHRWFSIIENSFRTRRNSIFTSYLKEIQLVKEIFITFEIKHIPQTQNTNTANLTRGVQSQPTYGLFGIRRRI